MSKHFKPAGHTAPPERRECKQAESKLEELAMEWMRGYDHNKDWDSNYHRALSMVRDVETSIDAAHALLVVDYPRELRNAYSRLGLFVSAIYNTIKPECIVLDVDAGAIGPIGYTFAGTLINKRTTGCDLGLYSSGVVMNTGTTEDYLGWGSSGVVVNTGTTGVNLGWMSSGVVVTLEEPESYGTLKPGGRFIKPQDCPAGFRKYVLELQRLIEGVDVHSIEALAKLRTALDKEVVLRELRRLGVLHE